MLIKYSSRIQSKMNTKLNRSISTIVAIKTYLYQHHKHTFQLIDAVVTAYDATSFITHINSHNASPRATQKKTKSHVYVKDIIMQERFATFVTPSDYLAHPQQPQKIAPQCQGKVKETVTLKFIGQISLYQILAANSV